MILKKNWHTKLSPNYTPKKNADEAQTIFEKRFQKGNITNATLPTASLTKIQPNSTIIDALLVLELAPSKSEAKRLVEQHAVKVNGNAISKAKDAINLKIADIVEVGRKAVRIEE